jgi:hypothetical protein
VPKTNWLWAGHSGARERLLQQVTQDPVNEFYK